VLLELLETWVDLAPGKLDEKIRRAKVALAQRCSGLRPKGVGALVWSMQVRCSIGAATAIGARSGVWRDGNPASGVPEIPKGAAPLQSRSRGHSPDYHRDGLADNLVPTPV